MGDFWLWIARLFGIEIESPTAPAAPAAVKLTASAPAAGQRSAATGRTAGRSVSAATSGKLAVEWIGRYEYGDTFAAAHDWATEKDTTIAKVQERWRHQVSHQAIQTVGTDWAAKFDPDNLAKLLRVNGKAIKPGELLAYGSKVELSGIMSSTKVWCTSYEQGSGSIEAYANSHFYTIDLRVRPLSATWTGEPLTFKVIFRQQKWNTLADMEGDGYATIVSAGAAVYGYAADKIEEIFGVDVREIVNEIESWF